MEKKYCPLLKKDCLVTACAFWYRDIGCSIPQIAEHLFLIDGRIEEESKSKNK